MRQPFSVSIMQTPSSASIMESPRLLRCKRQYWSIKSSSVMPRNCAMAEISSFVTQTSPSHRQHAPQRCQVCTISSLMVSYLPGFALCSCNMRRPYVNRLGRCCSQFIFLLLGLCIPGLDESACRGLKRTTDNRYIMHSH